jgi:hypothetical protein
LFRGSERTRLMTMIVMLGVIAMLMTRANDPHTWKMFAAHEDAAAERLTRRDLDRLEQEAAERFAGGTIKKPAIQKSFAPSGSLAAFNTAQQEDSQSQPEPPAAEANPAAEASPQAEAAPPADRPESADAASTAGEDSPEPAPEPDAPPAPVPADEADPAEQQFKPTDLDPEEVGAAREEFQAITDKQPLGPEEMNAYWRLFKWSRAQKTSEMRKRARGDITFAQLFTQPEKYRGQLVELRLHLRQASRYDATTNELGVKKVYELLGWNDNSRPYSYFLITDDVPEEMPIGQSIFEEGTFVGYFYKLMAYEDHEGKHRSAPIIIGRLVRHPSQTMLKQEQDAIEDKWTWIIGGGLLVIGLIAWITWYMMPKSKVHRGMLGARRDSIEEETVPIETWLERAEEGAPLPGIKSVDDSEVNDNQAKGDLAIQPPASGDSALADQQPVAPTNPAATKQ